MTFEDTLEPLMDAILSLKERVEKTPHMMWGTVATVSPLTVTLDGSTTPIPASTASTTPTVGDRVYLALQTGRAVIVATNLAPELYGTTPTPANLPTTGNWVGRQRWVESVNNFYVWTGTNWIPVGGAPPRIWSGTVNLTDTFEDHPFPAGVFTAPPNMSFSTFTASSGAIGASVMVSSRTQSTFRARKTGSTDSSVTFMYVAVQTP